MHMQAYPDTVIVDIFNYIFSLTAYLFNKSSMRCVAVGRTFNYFINIYACNDTDEGIKRHKGKCSNAQFVSHDKCGEYLF